MNSKQTSYFKVGLVVVLAVVFVGAMANEAIAKLTLESLQHVIWVRLQ